MTNKYRHWDKKSGFEEMWPNGNLFQCDTGFGPGKLTCYSQSCTTQGDPLQCTTTAKRFRGSGVLRVSLPRGYTVTGGGIYNNHRHFNKMSGFEESFPEGDNVWRGDMGFGSGDFLVYARGCKAPNGYKLKCITRTGPHKANYAHATCPGAYQLTGCGINNQYRKWNKLSGFEASRPSGNKCTCDSGFGLGKNTCYARCCKLVVDHGSSKASYKAAKLEGSNKVTKTTLGNSGKSRSGKAGQQRSIKAGKKISNEIAVKYMRRIMGKQAVKNASSKAGMKGSSKAGKKGRVSHEVAVKYMRRFVDKQTGGNGSDKAGKKVSDKAGGNASDKVAKKASNKARTKRFGEAGKRRAHQVGMERSGKAGVERFTKKAAAKLRKRRSA